MKLGLPIQWTIGGALLVLGGLLSSVGAAVFDFGPTQFGSLLTILGTVFEGGGLITVSFGYGAERVATWARRMLFASGVIVLIEFLLTLVTAFVVSLPSAIGAVLYVVLAALFLICAIAIFRGVPPGRLVKWALLPAAIYQAADLVLLLSGHGGEWWTLTAFGALYVLAGVIFTIHGRRHHR